MNILLDAGVAAIGLVALILGARLSANKLAYSIFKSGIQAKNSANYERAKELLAKTDQLATMVRGQESALASDARLYIAWTEIEAGNLRPAMNLLTLHSKGYFGMSPRVATGWIFVQQGDIDNGDQVLLESIRRLQKGTFQHASALCALGWVRIQQQRFREAEAMLRESLATLEQLFGQGSAQCMPTVAHLAWLKLQQRRYHEAIQCSAQVLNCYRKIFGENNPRTANALLLRSVIGLAVGEVELVAQDLRKAARNLKIFSAEPKRNYRCALRALDYVTSYGDASNSVSMSLNLMDKSSS